MSAICDSVADAARRPRARRLVEFALVHPALPAAAGRAVRHRPGRVRLQHPDQRGARRRADGDREPGHGHDHRAGEGQTAIVELNDPSVSVGFYQMAADGTPGLRRAPAPVAVGCLAVVSFEATYLPITPLIRNILFGAA